MADPETARSSRMVSTRRHAAPMVLRALCVVVFAAMPVSAVNADDAASCKKQAAQDFTANVRSCEQNLRGLPMRLSQCKRDAKARYDRARTLCDAQAQRKIGRGQRDFFGPDPPPPPPPPPKDPKPK